MKILHINLDETCCGFRQLYQAFSDAFKKGVQLKGTVIYINNDYVKGKITFFPVTRRIGIHVFELENFVDYVICRVPTKYPESYSFVFALADNDVQHAFRSFDENFDEMVKLGLNIKKNIYYSSANVERFVLLKKGTNSKAVSITFNKQEFNQHLSLFFESLVSVQPSGEYLKGYETMNTKMVAAASEIFNYDSLSSTKNLFLEGSVYRIIAMLVDKLKNKEVPATEKSELVEIARLMHVKDKLFQDFTKPCPPLEDMARLAHMSPTKFKIAFKTIFRMPYYKYYQHSRLMIARELLNKGLSVKEVAYEVGFHNTSHFTTTFKKQFKISPREIKNGR